ncbi:hypothetical protein BH09ACT4_BH09ACT4_09390 [soil metagenome]
MKLSYIYQPTQQADAAAAFFIEHLGMEEAWRDGDDTIGLWLPGRSAQLMLSTTDQPVGPMYLVDLLADWIAEHATVAVLDRYDIPGGEVARFEAPGGSVFYIYDQATAED